MRLLKTQAQHAHHVLLSSPVSPPHGYCGDSTLPITSSEHEGQTPAFHWVLRYAVLEEWIRRDGICMTLTCCDWRSAPRQG